MKLLRKNTEIRDQLHLMDAEGTVEEEPIEIEVQEHLQQEGWTCSNINIWHDSMMGFWRWNCKIQK